MGYELQQEFNNIFLNIQLWLRAMRAYGPSPIGIPLDFAFGFDRFKLESKVPEDPNEIAMLDKQRDILDFLMSELFATNPKSILAVKRESAKQSQGNEFDDYFGDTSILK